MAAGFYGLGAMAWGWKSSLARTVGPYRVVIQQVRAPGSVTSEVRGVGAIQRQVVASGRGAAQEVI